MLALSLVALIPRAAIGFCILRRIWRPVGPSALRAQIMLAAPVGIGFSSLNSFLWLWAGLDLHIYATAEVLAAAVVLVFGVWRHGRPVLERVKDLRVFLAQRQAAWLILTGLGVVVLLAGFWFDTVLKPHGSWDAWWNWNVVARFLYRGEAHWGGTFLRTLDHPDYPLLLAMANATTWELLQSETARGPAALALVFAISTAGLLYGLLWNLRGAGQAHLAAVVLITQPVFIHQAGAQYADVPLACYFLASAGLMLAYWGSQASAIPILAGFTAGLAAWTKNEGIPFVLVSALAWASLGRAGRRPAVGYFCAGLAYPLLTLIGFKVFLAPGNDLAGRLNQSLAMLSDVRRYTQLFELAVVHFWELGGGRISLVALLLVYAAIMGRARVPIPGLRQVVSIVVAQVAIYFAIYVATSSDLAWHVSTSLDRLFLHLLPLALLSLFVFLRSPWEPRSQDQESARGRAVGVEWL